LTFTDTSSFLNPNDRFAAQHIQPYEEFLHLRLVDAEKVSPAGGVDLLFHAHMLSPLHFAELCGQIRSSATSDPSPYVLEYDPWPDLDTSDPTQVVVRMKNFDGMSELWQRHFGWNPAQANFAKFGSLNAVDPSSAASGDAAVNGIASQLVLFVDGVTLAKLRGVSRGFRALIDSPVGDIAWANAARRDFGISVGGGDVRNRYQREWTSRRGDGTGSLVTLSSSSSESEDDDIVPLVRPIRPRPHPHPHPHPRPPRRIPQHPRHFPHVVG
jgi:hypothetical protein